MHKSIPISIIALLLIASPLMMTGTSNPNIFTKAMAIEEDYGVYETDEYTAYAMDIANGYGEGDEYESSSSSSSYTNDNDYKSKNSDFIKKIICDNINSNQNGLDGTPDLSALLGVEDIDTQGDEELTASAFGYGETNSNGYKNNDVFDLDCINNNNNVQPTGTGTGTAGQQGPPGPQGPQGPAGTEGQQGLRGERGPEGEQGPRGFNGTQGEQGPRGFNGTQGPAGPSQILTTNIYTALGNASATMSTALCNAGDTAISGGFTEVVNGQPGVVTSSQPTVGETGWVATIVGTGGAGDTITAIAICFDNPPLTP